MVLNFQLGKNIEALNPIEALDRAGYIFVLYKDKILCREEYTNDLAVFIHISNDQNLSSLIQKQKARAIKFGKYKGKDCILIYLTDINDMREEALENWNFKKLRSFYNIEPSDWFIIAGLAYQISQWDNDHIYCGRCGAFYQFSESEFSKKCEKCGSILYPQISPAIIILIRKGKKILLASNTRFPDEMYSLIAGFANVGETLEECIIREVKEEVGINIKNIQYINSQPWPFPNSLMLGFMADWDSGEIVCDGKEINDAKWFSIDELSTVSLPSSVSIARKIIDMFISEQINES